MHDYIPYGCQDINQKDIDKVVSVLKSEFITQGPITPQFEKAVTRYTKSKFAVATNSATSALHIACLALNLKEGDILWTSPISFVASANCARYCGAEIDFVDIDSNTFNISIEALKNKLSEAESKGKLPKIVIPVHLGGSPCEMKEIYMLSKKYGFKIIEDASHAIGTKFENLIVGDCHYSDITVFSFHPVKIITSGEGGMACTNKSDLASSMIRLRAHGIVKQEKDIIEKSHGPWYYEQVDLGFNYRLTDIHAALGLSQLSRIDTFVSKRNKLAKKYDRELGNLPIKKQVLLSSSYSSYHLYIIRIKEEGGKQNHLEIFKGLRRKNIGVNIHYIPIYMHPYYKHLGFKLGHCPEAEKYYSEAISLPIFSSISSENQNYVINSLRQLILKN